MRSFTFETQKKSFSEQSEKRSKKPKSRICLSAQDILFFRPARTAKKKSRPKSVFAKRSTGFMPKVPKDLRPMCRRKTGKKRYFLPKKAKSPVRSCGTPKCLLTEKSFSRCSPTFPALTAKTPSSAAFARCGQSRTARCSCRKKSFSPVQNREKMW